MDDEDDNEDPLQGEDRELQPPGCGHWPPWGREWPEDLHRDGQGPAPGCQWLPAKILPVALHRCGPWELPCQHSCGSGIYYQAFEWKLFTLCFSSQVSATDPDLNNIVTYDFSSPSQINNVYKIDKHTGKIYTNSILTGKTLQLYTYYLNFITL